ncbi:MAG: tetratricopeptide repeat protein [Candidatus Pacebacteria bacterium]|nr:tetratricopeptide repeat protein [Candidatus Paceibacterota bacterium]
MDTFPKNIENTNSEKHRLYILTGVAIISAVFAIVGWYLVLNPPNGSVPGNVSRFETPQNSSFIIPHVPYVGVHNNTDAYRYKFSRNDASAAIITVLEYWHPDGNDLLEVDRAFSSLNSFIGFTALEDYVDRVGDYVTKRETLTATETASYVNEGLRTPLLTLLPVAENQPEAVTYHPIVVLVGVDQVNKTLTFHDFWLGANRVITFDDFDKLQMVLSPSERYRFLVIQPRDIERQIEYVERQNRVYSLQTPTPAVRTLFEDYAISIGAVYHRRYDIAEEYLSKILLAGNFESELSALQKVLIYTQMGNVLNLLNKPEEALLYAKEAVLRNHDLNDAFGYWGDYSYLFKRNFAPYNDRISSAHRVLGDTYSLLGRFADARSEYEKALSITKDWLAQEGIDKLK